MPAVTSLIRGTLGQLSRQIVKPLRGCNNYSWTATNVDTPFVPRVEGGSDEDGALLNFVTDRIVTSGPVSVADYMRLCQAAPSSGRYYTSEVKSGQMNGNYNGGCNAEHAEVSQILGELLAIWIYYEVSCMDHFGPVQLIGLGAGSGALTPDILRTLDDDGFGADKISVHLVEINKGLREKQARDLCRQFDEIGDDGTAPVAKGIGWNGHPIQWYNHLSEVPRDFSVILAHEFFNSLPTHQFRRDDDGKWREIFVDFDAIERRLTFALAPTENLHQKVCIPKAIRDDPKFSEYEACPSAVSLSEDIAVRVSEDGGAALIMDYGHSGNRQRLSFRAYDHHSLVDPLTPGAADFTSDVNFAAVKTAFSDEDRCRVYGPISQEDFLGNMSVQFRYERLLRQCKSDTQLQELLHSYEIVKRMGKQHKVLLAFPKTLDPVLKQRRSGPSGTVQK